MNKRVLITGGAGFVGSNLAVFLKNRLAGFDILCLDNLIRPGSEINTKRLLDEGITFIKGDVRSKNELLKLPKIDLLLDCCAEPSVPASYQDPQYTTETNLFGTINCLELARRDQADFIFLSTSRVYPVEALNNLPFVEQSSRFEWEAGLQGYGYSSQGINTDFPLSGVKSLYGATKLASEHLILEYLDIYSLKGVINRFGVIAGPWQMGRIDQGIVGYWVMRHKYSKDLSFIGFGGSGKQVRDVLHIDDVCELIWVQIQNIKKVDRKIFNVGGGRKNSVSLLELSAISRQVTGQTLDIRPDPRGRRGDIRIYITDNRAVSQELKWAPQKNVETVVADINSWLDQYHGQLKPLFT